MNPARQQNGLIVANFDASHTPQGSCVGFIVYLETGKVERISERVDGMSSSNEAEFKAAILALEFIAKNCVRHGDTSVLLSGDNESVIEMLQGVGKARGHLLPYFQLARKLAAPFKAVTYSHISRRSNRAADFLSRQMGRTREEWEKDPRRRKKRRRRPRKQILREIREFGTEGDLRL
ncbi:MAG: ribonuclease HI family protein [Bdellovibrionota bacterium]